jgi:NAD+ synthetase
MHLPPRAPCPEQLLAAKIGRVQAWFAANGLDAAVVGVSGGVDSAVVLGLLQFVARAPVSPLRRVVALILPIDGPGATGQGEARARAEAVADAFGAERWVAPLGAAHAGFLAALSEGSGLDFDGWAAGQLLSVVRTPALYGAAALLQAHGHRSVVVGTTNRDEGAYLGFFGKASDGMVDLQPISDLHKSEVYALARVLGVPDAVLSAPPSGDVWDGRTDAEMIGARYEDVETVLRLREIGRDPSAVAATLPDGGRLSAANRAVEALHRANAHKYRVGAPSVHLDVLPRGVPGGWSDQVLSGRHERRPVDVPGAWDPPPIALDPTVSLPEVAVDGPVTLARGVLTEGDCHRLLAAFAAARAEPVDITGRRDAPEEQYGVGSVRATAFSPSLAADLWHRVRPAVPTLRCCGPLDATDACAAPGRSGHVTWRVVGLSPLLRFMRYDAGGRHLCHYDAGYDYGDGRRTLVSVVFYLTDARPEDGGCTRIVEDGQAALPVWARDHRDWTRDAREDEVRVRVRPERGAAALFDHRVCHDVETWRGPGPRVIIRADVVYEAVPDGRGLGP